MAAAAVGGLGRLAGIGKNAIKAYVENPLVGAGVQTGLDFSLSMLQGVDPLTSATSALGTGIGSFSGRKLGGLVGQPGSEKRAIAEFVGEGFGGIAGGTVGTFVPQLMGMNQLPNPDSAQQDPRPVQLQQQAMQNLTPEQMQRLQERAQRRAAEAAYQAQAMQQYGGMY